MSDLEIIADEVQRLASNFQSIKETMSLAEGEKSEIIAGKNTIGHKKLCDAVDDFNQTVSDRKNKYAEKTESFIAFLQTVTTGSDELDNQLAQALNE